MGSFTAWGEAALPCEVRHGLCNSHLRLWDSFQKQQWAGLTLNKRPSSSQACPSSSLDT